MLAGSRHGASGGARSRRQTRSRSPGRESGVSRDTMPSAGRSAGIGGALRGRRGGEPSEDRGSRRASEARLDSGGVHDGLTHRTECDVSHLASGGVEVVGGSDERGGLSEVDRSAPARSGRSSRTPRNTSRAASLHSPGRPHHPSGVDGALGGGAVGVVLGMAKPFGGCEVCDEKQEVGARSVATAMPSGRGVEGERGRYRSVAAPANPAKQGVDNLFAAGRTRMRSVILGLASAGIRRVGLDRVSRILWRLCGRLGVSSTGESHACNYVHPGWQNVGRSTKARDTG